MPMIIRWRRCFYLFHMWSVRVCVWEVDKSCYALLIYTFSTILLTYKHVNVRYFWSKKYELFPRIVSVYNWHPTYVHTMSHTLHRSLLPFISAAQPNDAIRIQCKLLLLIGLERVGCCCCVNTICIQCNASATNAASIIAQTKFLFDGKWCKFRRTVVRGTSTKNMEN